MAMRVVIAPDSFKGSVSSLEAAQAIEAGLRSIGEPIDVVLVPMADGGEGTAEALQRILGGVMVEIVTTDPLDRPIMASYAWMADRCLAVIEMAAASGLPLLRGDLNPADASSYGTGVLISHALAQGAREIILGLGGSATNDGGAGMMSALGVRFMDAHGALLRGCGGTLGKIATVDLSGLDRRLADVRITVASDVTSPLLGPDGATYVFGPQKGVAPDQLAVFDAAMARYADVVDRAMGTDCRHASGSGAAGGMGYALRSMLDVTFQDGFSLMAAMAGLETLIAGADLVITGEGKLDAQSLVGKVPVNIARMGQAAGVPVVAFAGAIDGTLAALRLAGLSTVIPVVDRPMTLDKAMAEGAILLERAAARFMAALLVGGKRHKS